MSASDAAIVLGVDGGGTKTIAILADRQGTVIGYGRAGSCDIYSHPGAADEVERAVAQACARAGIDRQRIGCGVFSLAGADWPEDFDFWRQAVAARRLATDALILNDAVGAMNADFPQGNAVAVVCGTGAAIGSRNDRGAIWHSSFWQLVQGGGELSDNVRNAIYRSHLGIAPPTSLTPPVLRHHGATGVEDLLHMFTGRERQRPAERANLVPILCAEAEAGDTAAIDILRQHGAALADYAFAAARKVDIAERPFHLLLKGGVFRNRSQILRTSLIQRMTARSLQFSVFESTSEPVKGALVTALTMAGVTLSPELGASIERTLPADGFFHTGL